MSEAKTVRLEIRLPEKMLDEIRRIAPPDGSGRPNVSAFVRDALEREIQRNTTDSMVNWAKKSLSTSTDIEEDW